MNLKDLPLLVAALCTDCRWLVSFNTYAYQPGHREVTGLWLASTVLDEGFHYHACIQVSETILPPADFEAMAESVLCPPVSLRDRLIFAVYLAS